MFSASTKYCIFAAGITLLTSVRIDAFAFPVGIRGTLCRPVSSSSRVAKIWTKSVRMATTEEKPPETTAPPEPTEKAAPKAALVQVNTENTEFSAGVLGGVAGFLVGGPFLGAILAIAANYGSKRENEAGDAVRAIAKNAIEAFNFLSTLNSKYDVSGKAGASLDEAVSKLKKQSDSEAIDKVEKTVKDITSQATKLSSEYDLAAKAKQALGVAGELADTAIVKGIELEKEYSVTNKVKDAVKKSIDGAQSSSTSPVK